MDTRIGSVWPLLGVWLWVAAGCAVNPVTGKSDFVLLSESQEISLGSRYHEQVRTQYGEYETPALQALVERVGQRLARTSHRPELHYRFTLLDSPEVNAFALPGGYVYITRGLLAYLNSEAELAAVLGHEIGHVTARHSVRQHSAQTVTGLFGAILGSQVGGGGQELINLAGTALVRGYGREHELEADRLGAEYLARSGYDPDAMLQVIRVLKNQELHEIEQARKEGREPRIYHGLFSTHPDNDQRLQEVVGAARGLAKGAGSAEQDVTFLRQLDGLVFGDSEQQGIVRGDRFYHGPLGVTIDLPKGWRTINGTQRLLLVSPQRDAFVVVEHLPRKSGVSLESLLKEQFGGQVPRSAFRIDEPGREGFGGTLRLSTPFGWRQTRVLLIRISGETFQLIAASDQEPWPANHARAIRDTFHGLRALSSQDQSLARAWRLDLRRVQSGQGIAELAAFSPRFPEAQIQIRLLNDLYPNKEPSINQWVKIIQ